MTEPPATVDAYIASFPEPALSRLEKIRAVLRTELPEAVEKISYGIPTFHQGRNLVHFAGYANHTGFYPGAAAMAAFAAELTGYQHAKGSVRFPHDAPLPIELIVRMTRFRLEEEKRHIAQTKKR